MATNMAQNSQLNYYRFFRIIHLRHRIYDLFIFFELEIRENYKLNTG